MSKTSHSQVKKTPTLSKFVQNEVNKLKRGLANAGLVYNISDVEIAQKYVLTKPSGETKDQPPLRER